MTLFLCFILFPLRDSADRVIGENGRYEELIASSHEIAASTAQLVAASKVQTWKQNCLLFELLNFPWVFLMRSVTHFTVQIQTLNEKHMIMDCDLNVF